MDTNTMHLDLIEHTLDRSDAITTPGEHLLCGMMIQLLDHVRDLKERVEAIERSRECFAEHDLPRIEARIETLEEGH